jgi:hypothetical protein
MGRNPSIAHLSLMSELQPLINKASDREGIPGGVLLSYSGLLSKKLSEAIVDLTQNAVSQSGAPRAELLRAKSVVSDCLSSILTNGLIDDNGETLFYLIIDSTENGLSVNCGAFINEELSNSFENKVQYVNELSISDLRKKSVELLCQTDGLENSNSGLCLINIALNCNRPFNFSITKKESGINLFSIDLIINHALA